MTSIRHADLAFPRHPPSAKLWEDQQSRKKNDEEFEDSVDLVPDVIRISSIRINHGQHWWCILGEQREQD